MANIINVAPIEFDQVTIDAERIKYTDEVFEKLNETHKQSHLIKRRGDSIFLVPLSINARILELIKVYRRKCRHGKDHGNLFTTNGRKKIYPMFLWRLVRRYFKPEKVGINASAHVLRHSIATHLYHNRVPLHSIKRFLGHKSLKTTVLYLHFGPDHLKKGLPRCASQREADRIEFGYVCVKPKQTNLF